MIELKEYIGIGVTVMAAMFGFVKLYARTFTTTLAEETARLVTLEQKTTIEETVRTEFAKQTNTHQIVTAEYAKMRFTRLDELLKALYDLKDRAEAFVLMPAMKNDQDFKEFGQTFLVAYGEAHRAINMAAMYIDDKVRVLTESFMQDCMQALGLSSSVNMSKKLMDDYKNQEENEERRQIIRDYLDESRKLKEALNKLPALFIALQGEYKQHLKEF